MASRHHPGRTDQLGRIGGWVVALGIGAGVTTGLGCGIAWAESDDASCPSSSDSSLTREDVERKDAGPARVDRADDETVGHDETVGQDAGLGDAGTERGADPGGDGEEDADEVDEDGDGPPPRSPRADHPTEPPPEVIRSIRHATTGSSDDHENRSGPPTSRRVVSMPTAVPADRTPVNRATDDTPNPAGTHPALLTLVTSVGRDTEQMSSRQHLQFSRTTTEIEQDADGKTAPAVPASFTGEPSAASKVTTAVFRAIRAVTGVLGLEFVTDIGPLIASESPPWFTTIGVKVRRSEFDGMPVVALGPPRPSGKYVVAVHGGAYVVKPTVFEWLQYASWARDTGATVLMPLYPLAPGGTARTVVPVIADLISNEIEQHGARNVSVTGTSAGGGIALTAVQELVRRGDQVPSHMVLSSPALDLTVSNPAIQFVDDPILTSTTVRRAQQWAGDLELTDPLVSPLYGSLAGLPPTAIYSGSLDLLAPDVLVLQDKAIATKGSDVTFVLRKDQLHAWAGIFWLPEAQALLPDIYRQLGLL